MSSGKRRFASLLKQRNHSDNETASLGLKLASKINYNEFASSTNEFSSSDDSDTSLLDSITVNDIVSSGVNNSEIGGSPMAIVTNVSVEGANFEKRQLDLMTSQLVGRSNGRGNRSQWINGFFNCKVLSRRHALIWFDFKEWQFFIQDEKSSNGTFLNSRRLESKVPYQIYTNDLIQFGQDVFEGSEKHPCILARLQLLFPDGSEETSRPNGKPDDIRDEIKENRNEESDVKEALVELKNCLDEARTRQTNIGRKLQESKEIVGQVNTLVRERWDQVLHEDILLAKIDRLEEQLSAENQPLDGELSKRMKLEQNVKRMLQDSSKAKLEAEIRAFNCEEALKRRLTAELPVNDIDVTEVVSPRESHDVSIQCEFRPDSRDLSEDIILVKFELNQLKRFNLRLVRIQKTNNIAIWSLALALIFLCCGLVAFQMHKKTHKLAYW